MDRLETLQAGFVAFVDGLWWGLRDNVGALSMYEGYRNGFKQMGKEVAKKVNAKGKTHAAAVAGEIFSAIGLHVEVEDSEIYVKECPIFNRILERGLEFAFHIEEICWKPLLEGIAEVAGVKSNVNASLRLNHIERSKAEYKMKKAKAAFEAGKISEDEFRKQEDKLKESIEHLPKFGHYRFE